MIKFVRQWMLQRKLARWADYHSNWLGMENLIDDLFYVAKEDARYQFPGAMVEFADGVVTVVQNGLVAKVRV